MNIKDLNVFITTAKEQNLTKASRLLYMTPQGISKIIKNMESECDCGLFLRTGNGMKLSECGKHFLVYAEKMLQEYHEFYYRECPDKQVERWFAAREGNVAFSLGECDEELYDVLELEIFPIKLLVNEKHSLSRSAAAGIEKYRTDRDNHSSGAGGIHIYKIYGLIFSGK